jgi:hypothetical protein
MISAVGVSSVDVSARRQAAVVIRRQKTVPLGCDSILTARDMGIKFGDEMPSYSAIGL